MPGGLPGGGGGGDVELSKVMSVQIERCLEGTQTRFSSSLQLLAALRCEFSVGCGGERKTGFFFMNQNFFATFV